MKRLNSLFLVLALGVSTPFHFSFSYPQIQVEYDWNGYCQGYAEGYKAGYCQNNVGCIVSVPLCPTPNVGETVNRTGGFTRGVIDGANAAMRKKLN